MKIENLFLWNIPIQFWIPSISLWRILKCPLFIYKLQFSLTFLKKSWIETGAKLHIKANQLKPFPVKSQMTNLHRWYICTEWNLKNQSSSHKKCEHLNLQIYVSRYLSFKIICKEPLIDWNLKNVYHAKPKICKIVVFTYTLIHFRYNHQSLNRNGRNWKKN